MQTSSITYLGDLRTESSHLKSGKTYITDAPVDNNGKGEAFSPTDLASTSLGNCAITIMGIAGKNEDIDFAGTTLKVTKVMSAEPPRKIAKITVEFDMKSNVVLTAEQQKRYERLAHNCPVALSLHPDLQQEMIFNW